MTEEAWTMRPYRIGDEERICALFQLVFGKELSAERWNWQYRDNHTGQQLITLAEGKGGELAGHYALRPVRMKVGDQERLCALSLDTMVHPDYRRQGVFVQLASHMYRVAAEQGIPFTYGFPNKNSRHGIFRRLGWAEFCGQVPIFARILNPRAVLGRRIRSRFLLSVATPLAGVGLAVVAGSRKGRLPSDCRLTRVSCFDERMDAFWQAASPAYAIIAVRDQAYLNWRYVEKPGDEYALFVVERGGTVSGYMVLKCEERFGLRVGFIVDLLTLPGGGQVGSGMIAEAVRYLREESVDIIGCLMLAHTPYARCLRDNGFLIVPRQLFPQELYLGVCRHTDDYSLAFVTEPRNWFITWGDHDVV